MSECVNMVGVTLHARVEKTKEKNCSEMGTGGIVHCCANSWFLKYESVHRYGCMSVYVYMTMYCVCVCVFS